MTDRRDPPDGAAAFEPPDYVSAWLPQTNPGYPTPFTTCTFCAAVVFDTTSHTTWHLHLWTALK